MCDKSLKAIIWCMDYLNENCWKLRWRKVECHIFANKQVLFLSLVSGYKKMFSVKLIVKEIYVKLELTTKSYIHVLIHYCAHKGHTFHNFMCQLKLLKINKGRLEKQLPGWLSSFNMYVCMHACVCMQACVYVCLF